jgi:hypothetical protein
VGATSGPSLTIFAAVVIFLSSVRVAIKTCCRFLPAIMGSSKIPFAIEEIRSRHAAPDIDVVQSPDFT